ncbi:hypothetical protein RHSIM_Rhsim01G0111800 [Rhododendron simsii]|uniref:Uncharacterized protein n=1 Tax=Rhododendron simsii TaxID=118357 RepID=A0A834LXI3_RHOSS|nr:hypothetical protein RHSIM_Rhsim01G0111800 [Rhododendron simsii]
MVTRVQKRNDGGIGILAELSNLEELDLSSNTLDNSILPSLNKLSNLKFLNLATNALNGSISAKEFGSLNNLKELDLSSNQVVSILTVNGLRILSNLSNLENIDLRYNGLDNIILPSLNKLSNLKILNLAGNKLNGSIFIKEFDGLSNLKELDLSKNAKYQSSQQYVRSIVLTV